ncbi:MAG TPA: family 78 glycoside hydrolase catalytic domain [Candidatus Dormibacteraeota bacterium]|nr:family 78 glycoside hydrolase catalytic domain [Candidatus Dormibacteraeota bacterium]
MKRPKILIVFIAILLLASAADAAPVRLRCEYLENPLGIDVAVPHLSWQSDNSERNWKQFAYEVLVASSEEDLQAGKAVIWDSGKVESAESVGVAYRGPALASRKRYYWKVRVWDAKGTVSESTEGAWWETGLLQTTDWKAKWIHWKNPEDEADRQGIRWIWVPGEDALAVVPKTAATFRVTFTLANMAREAILSLATRGDFVARVNGREIDAKSRWATFDRRDISEQLVMGENVIEVTVTAPPSPTYGPNAGAKTTMASLAALVKITGSDGKIIRYPTNEKWKATLKQTSGWQSAHVVAELTDKRLGDPGPLPQPAAYLRRTLALTKSLQSARLYVTALGSYRVFLNGQRVGGDVLTPDFTDYRKRVVYQTYDVTHLLTHGKNAIGALLGDGWYGSGLTWVGVHFFSPPDRLMAQLELDYADGSHETVVTDESWKAAASPIVRSDIYGGEVYDARREQVGWAEPGFDDPRWMPAVVSGAPDIKLSSQITAPARVIATLDAKGVTPASNGAYIFDMGQNMVGWATLKVKGVAGTKVQMRFAEILNPDGTIYTANLRNADATDVYILRGGDEETFSPHFTFHGFRYVEVTGYPGTPPLDAIKGEVVSSVSGEPAAKLTTSSALVNHMWMIGLWGQRGNFLSVPTDCPQRDERLGWMGDAGVFWRTGTYNFNVAAFSQKFIQDIVDAQTSQGAFTNVSPDTLPFEGGGTEGPAARNENMVGAPGWGDAGIIVPWTTWVQYGDRAVIAENWDAMRRWMDFIQSRNPDFLRTRGVGPNFADWLAPDAHTNKDLLATAYWALIANMMSQMAHAIGKDADAEHYDDVVQNIRAAFQKKYIKEDGTVGTGTQTSYVVALYTKMAPAALEPMLVDKLVKDIEARDWHLSTGFLGTPFLLFTLADHGRSDVAYRLLLNDTYPSWGYMLSKGATTWWERWNGDTGDPAMNSYNHYAFGSVIAWVYRYAAGIDTTTDAPGFKEIIVHPHLDSRLTSARAEYDSIYGKIVSDWKGTPAGPFSLKVEIPANTSAKVFLPAIAGARLTEDGSPVESQTENGSYVIRLGSGSYSFEVK